MRWTVLAVILASIPHGFARADVVATFEDQSLAPNSWNNNAGGGTPGTFTSYGINFSNSYYSSTYWTGFAISNRTETVPESTPAGDANNQYAIYQYDAYPASGAGGSATYGIYYDPGYVNLMPGSSPVSMDVANTLYTYLTLVNGNRFAAAFKPGNYFTLTITGYAGAAETGGTVGTPVNFDLARYNIQKEGDPPVQNHPLQTWATIDLTPLIGARSLGFSFASSDVGDFGINTPLYFAVDNLRVVPEPASFILIAIGLGGILVRGFRTGP